MRFRIQSIALILGLFALVACQGPVYQTPSATGNGAQNAPSRGVNDDIAYNGNDNGQDVILQTFSWNSASLLQPNYYNTLATNASGIRAYFTYAWLPPPANSADIPGYMPGDWKNLKNNYGTQAELKSLIAALQPATGRQTQVLADIVVNHRAGTGTPINYPGQGSFYNNYNYGNEFNMTGENFIFGNEDNYGSGKGPSGFGLASEGTWTFGGRTYHNEDFVGSPDLNHWNANTRGLVASWLNWLKKPLNAGFNGWRYDMIGGYSPEFLGSYNDQSLPTLSVGEKTNLCPRHRLSY